MNDSSYDDKTKTHVVLAKGATVAHYKIIEKIGAGGMGEVYLAEDTKLNRKVALKFLSPLLCQDKDCRARFKREAQAAARLDHPNVVTIHEVGEFQNRPYFAMQHVTGQSLKDVVKGNDLSLDRIVDLVIQICEGLSKAHQSDIVHRDVKPSNVVIDADGRPKLLDFGLAAIKDTDQLTKTGSTLGTIGYMSPEQVRGKDTDHRSDLFSLGIVLYEMIAGRLPFKGDTEAATMNSVLNETPEPLSRYKSGVSDKLQDIVSKLLEKDPSLRYQSAAGVISDLKRLIAPTQSSIAATPARRPSRWPLWTGVGVVAASMIAVLGWQFLYVEQKPIETEAKKMLAVLPFENLGAPEDEYFADGITDEITSRLGIIKELGVISRTSAMQYKNTDKGLPEIARELGVDYILEGTIRWDKISDTSLVRITPQLIRVSDNTHLWAENYERALIRIFSVQADIATQIAEALNIALLEPERQSLLAKPTENLEAYNYYLRGNDYAFHSLDSKDNLIAIDMYEKAVALDTGFALAYAKIARVSNFMYFSGMDKSVSRVAQSKRAIEKALAYGPDLPEVQLALAQYYYHGERDYERALEICEIMRNSLPNSPDLHSMVAFIKRRQGKWQDCIQGLKQAIRLDPRSPSYQYELAGTFGFLRRYREAEYWFDRVIALEPDKAAPYSYKASLFLLRNADTTKAREVLQGAVGMVNQSRLLYSLARCDVLERDFESALSRLPAMLAIAQIDSADYYLTKGRIYYFMGENSLSVTYYDSARAFLEESVVAMERSVREAFEHCRLGIAYAGLGKKIEAIREGELGHKLLPLSKDCIFGMDIIESLAEIYTIVGEHDLAVDQLEILLSNPSDISAPLVRIDPIWDPLRDNPRFQALIEKYDRESGTGK